MLAGFAQNVTVNKINSPIETDLRSVARSASAAARRRRLPPRRSVCATPMCTRIDGANPELPITPARRLKDVSDSARHPRRAPPLGVEGVRVVCRFRNIPAESCTDCAVPKRAVVAKARGAAAAVEALPRAARIVVTAKHGVDRAVCRRRAKCEETSKRPKQRRQSKLNSDGIAVEQSNARLSGDIVAPQWLTCFAAGAPLRRSV